MQCNLKRDRERVQKNLQDAQGLNLLVREQAAHKGSSKLQRTLQACQTPPTKFICTRTLIPKSRVEQPRSGIPEKIERGNPTYLTEQLS